MFKKLRALRPTHLLALTAILATSLAITGCNLQQVLAGTAFGEPTAPDNDTQCTDSNYQQALEWRADMEEFLTYPRQFGCDGPPYPTGPLRADKTLSLFEHLDDHYIVPEQTARLVHPSRLDGDDRDEISAQVELRIGEEAKLLDITRDRPSGIVFPVAGDTTMEGVDMLLSELVEHDILGLQDGNPLLILLAGDQEQTGAEPDPANWFSDGARNRVNEVVGDFCGDTPIETSRNFHNHTHALNRKMGQAGADCPRLGLPADELFRYEQFSSPGQELLELWWGCDCEADIELLLAAHHLDVWHQDFYPLSVLQVELSPDGETIEVTEDDTWVEVVDQLQSHHGEPVHITTPALEEEESVFDTGAVDSGGAIVSGLDVSYDPQIDGPIDDEAVDEVVREHSHEIGMCHHGRLRDDRSITGDLTVDWTLTADGDATEITITDSTVDDDRLEQCVVNHIAAWSFPAPDDDGAVQISYTFSFGTGQRLRD